MSDPQVEALLARLDAALDAAMAVGPMDWMPQEPQGPCNRWQFLDLDECGLHGGGYAQCVAMGRAA